MFQLFSYIYRICLWLYIILLFIIVPIFAFPFSLIMGRKRSFRLFFKLFIKLGLLILGVYPIVTGKENIPKKQKVILISNHPGFLDPFQLNAALPGFYNFIIFAKQLFNPISMLTIINADIVARSSGHALVGAKTVRAVIEKVNKGDSFILIPTEMVVKDGTIDKVNRSLYGIISSTEAVILPVHISGGISLFVPKGPLRSKIVIGKPISKNDILMGRDLFIIRTIASLKQ